MRPRQLRVGELLALAGVALVAVALTRPWYEGAISGRLDAWDTFGPGVALILAATCAALAMVLSALFQRSAALPVSLAVWSVLLGLAGVLAAVVRVLERPDHAGSLCIGAWLALIGTCAMLAGSWLALRDERPGLYEPSRPTPRPRP